MIEEHEQEVVALEEQLEVLETTEAEEKQKRQELTKEISEEIISLQLELDEKMAEREEMEAENGRLIAQVEQMSEQIALTEKQLVERTEIHQVGFYDYLFCDYSIMKMFMYPLFRFYEKRTFSFLFGKLYSN